MDFNMSGLTEGLNELQSMECKYHDDLKKRLYDRLVYHDGIITFKAGDVIEEARIISANLSETAFSFEFRWDRNKIIYSISCPRNGQFFSGSAFYLLNGKHIPFRISDACFDEPLVFRGMWFEDSVMWEFAINFASFSIVKE